MRCTRPRIPGSPAPPLPGPPKPPELPTQKPQETTVKTFLKTALCAAALTLAAQGSALAQAGAFPNKPIRIVVPFTPGGTNDIVGRLIAAKLTEKFGWATVVDNRGGAGGAIGSAFVAGSPPDGYTLLVVSTSHTIVPAVQKISYNAVTSFTPIGMMGYSPSAIAATPGLPANNLAEAIAYSKANPGKLSYSFAGIGSISQFIGELFNAAAGVKMVPVSYKGGAPALNDLMAGHVQIYHGGLSPMLPLLKAGKIKVLAVTTQQRSPAAPDVPAVSETLQGFDAGIWYGIFGPAGMPADVTAKINSAVNTIMRDPDVVRDMDTNAITARTSTPQEFAKVVATDTARWAEVAKSAGIKGEQ